MAPAWLLVAAEQTSCKSPKFYQIHLRLSAVKNPKLAFLQEV
jgi:hypothetical protein